MFLHEGIITRLIARVRALYPTDWRGRAGQRFRKTIGTVSDFVDEHHIKPGEVLGEGVELGRRKLEGMANQEFAQATKNFADTEKIKIESELQRRSLESDVAKREADARKAWADARIQELKAVDAELDLLEKLKNARVVLHRDAGGNLTALPAPPTLDFARLRQRMLQHQAITGREQMLPIIRIWAIIDDAAQKMRHLRVAFEDREAMFPPVYTDQDKVREVVGEIFLYAERRVSASMLYIDHVVSDESVLVRFQCVGVPPIGVPPNLEDIRLRPITEMIVAMGGNVSARNADDVQIHYAFDLKLPRADFATHPTPS